MHVLPDTPPLAGIRNWIRNMPGYWKLLQATLAVEILGHRMVWSLVFGIEQRKGQMPRWGQKAWIPATST